MKYIIILIYSFVLISCSIIHGNRFVKKVRNNPKELIIFKDYLEKNVTNNFSQYKIITPNRDPSHGTEDSTIISFCKKFKIFAIDIKPCNNNNAPDNHFNKCENTVRLRYKTYGLFGENYSLIFDYSEEGLKLKDGLDEKKYKIVDRIFLF